MTEYKILQEQDVTTLQSLAQDYIDNASWLPIGGVSVHVDPVYIGDGQFQYYTYYTQAIMKTDVPKEK